MKKENHNFIDLTDQRFGKLLVIKRRRNAQGRARWLCGCDCGNVKIILAKELRNGHTKSCGCSQFDGPKLRKKPGGALRQLFVKTKNRADKNSRVFNFNLEEFIAISIRPCVYCGREKSSANRYKDEVFRYNGLDRVNSGEGYTKDNTVPCCKFCNIMKMDLTLEEFLDQVERICAVTTLKKQMGL